MLFYSTQNLVMTVLFWVFLGVKVWALIDCIIRPSNAFPAAGRQTKLLWVVILAIAAATAYVTSPVGLLGIAGIVAALAYLLDVRPRVQEVSGRGGDRRF